jgi:1-pyrroline-5-carboxylate dehydrogenase
MSLNQGFAPTMRTMLRSQVYQRAHVMRPASRPLLRAGVATSGHFNLPNARNEENVSTQLIM